MSTKKTSNGQKQQVQDQSLPASQNLVPLGQYIKDFSFENPQILKYISENRQAPDINLNVQVQANQAGESVFEVTLNVTAEGKYNAETAFLTELSYAGLFGSPLKDAEKLKRLLLIEAPQFLFPFARQIIANTTQNGGMIPPLLLMPIDFEALYQNQQAGETAEQPAPAPARQKMS